MQVMEVQPQRGSLELKKSVAAIHSSSSLTLVQRKIANALLYNAYDDLLKKDRHVIHIRYLSDLIGYNSKDFVQIKRALIKLISTVIEWNLVDKDKLESGGVWNASAIIADATIDGSWCTYSYSESMRSLLHRPELYGKLNMKVMSQFKSTYGLALYENCVRYQGIFNTPWFTMDTFRKLMGVYDDKYMLFRDFKKRVIDQAVTEVNNVSHISISPKYKTENRKIVAIQFSIQKKTVVTELSVIPDSEDSSKKIELTLCHRFGFSEAQAKKALINYDDEYILEKMSLVESTDTFQAGKIINLAKYLSSALAQDFKPPKSSLEIVKPMFDLAAEEKKKKQSRDRKLSLYREYQNKEILNIFKNLSEQEKKPILKSFDAEVSKTFYYKLFLQEGVENPLVKDIFLKFFHRNYKDLMGSLLSFEAFSVEEKE